MLLACFWLLTKKSGSPFKKLISPHHFFWSRSSSVGPRLQREPWLSSSKARSVQTVWGRGVRCVESEGEGEEGLRWDVCRMLRSVAPQSRRPGGLLLVWRLYVRVQNAAFSYHSVQPRVGFPFPGAGSRQAIGGKATTANPCGARTRVFSYLLLCVPEPSLEIILSKHVVLQESKPRQREDKKYTRSHTTRKWLSQVLGN